MALSLATVGGKITASFINLIVASVNRQGLTAVIPTSVSGTGAVLSANGLITCTATPTLNIIGAHPADLGVDFMVLLKLTSSGSSETLLRLRTGGADAATNYAITRLWGNGSSAVSDTLSGTTTYFAPTVGSPAGRRTAKIELLGPNVAAATQFLSTSNTAGFAGLVIGSHSTATAYPDLTISTIGGVETLTGTVQILAINPMS